MKLFLPIICIAVLLSSCNNSSTPQAGQTDSTKVQPPSAGAMVEKTLTREEQSALTPDAVLQMLKDGNTHFVKDSLTLRKYSAQVQSSASGQYPKAVILSCIDSRVPVEEIFDQGIGDVFVARVAGNIENEDILGSMEYGCKVAGAKLIVVLGHTSCGAIHSAIDNVKLGNITAMLAHIMPAVDSCQSFNGEKDSHNHEYLDAVTMKNVQLVVKEISSRSEVLRNMDKKGEIKIVGAVYDVATGNVTFI